MLETEEPPIFLISQAFSLLPLFLRECLKFYSLVFLSFFLHMSEVVTLQALIELGRVGTVGENSIEEDQREHATYVFQGRPYCLRCLRNVYFCLTKEHSNIRDLVYIFGALD